MNHFFVLLGLEAWKPVLSALLLPPVPFLVAILVGARLLPARRVAGWVVIALSLLGVWLTSTSVMGHWLERRLLAVPPALSAERIDTIRRDPHSRTGTAIVVLGSGVEPLAPEYGVSNLSDLSLQRLRYGLWLGRETGVPVAFSGGSGWAQDGGGSEADAAARIASQDFGRPLRWTEGESHDTRENATRMIPLLKRAGVTRILLVTHGWHMPRARSNFEQAAATADIAVEPAPMGLASVGARGALAWMPSADGFRLVRVVLHEALGRLAGA